MDNGELQKLEWSSQNPNLYLQRSSIKLHIKNFNNKLSRVYLH